MILRRTIFLFTPILLIFFAVSHPQSAQAAPPTAPLQVAGLSAATTTPSSSEALSWTAPGDGGQAITDYVVEYRVRGDADWIPVAHSASTATALTLTGLDTDVIYQFHVSAINGISPGGAFSDPYDFINNPIHTYVDASFLASDNTDTRVLGINEFNTIQAAINATDFSGGVQVAAGTYSEHLHVTGKVQLTGYDSSFTEGAPSDAPVLIAPDCDTMLAITNQSSAQGFFIDGNDPDHLCTQPVVYFEEDANGGISASTIANANIAIEAATSEGGATILLNVFQNVAVGLQADGTQHELDAVDNFWGDPSGPYEAKNNSAGEGFPITGAAADQVNFRPYLTNPDDSSVSSITVTSNHVQDLFDNGGTFTYSGDSLDAADSVAVNEHTTITVPSAGGTSSVSIEGDFFNQIIMRSDLGDPFDATQISASSIPSASISGNPDSVIGALQWGIPEVQLDYDDPGFVTINLFVGDQYDGQTLPVYRSKSLSSDWTQDGIVDPASCVVASGLCSFEATSSSYFIATGTVIPPVNQTPIIDTSSGGGTVVGLIGSTKPFTGIGSGYVAPRPQIVYPDGRVVYLDQQTLAPLTGAQATTSACLFTKDLSFGMRDAAVQQLQQFLNSQGFTVSQSGAGSVGQETTYLGPATQAALVLFQKKNNIEPAAGYFGPITRKKVNPVH